MKLNFIHFFLFFVLFTMKQRYIYSNYITSTKLSLFTSILYMYMIRINYIYLYIYIYFLDSWIFTMHVYERKKKKNVKKKRANANERTINKQTNKEINK